MSQPCYCEKAELVAPYLGAWVHVPCGGRIKGYVGYRPSHCFCAATVGAYQACSCETRRPWPGCDVAEEFQLCLVCARGKAGGPSRWSHLACDTCREEKPNVDLEVGYEPHLPWGRHSIMNGRRISPTATSEETEVQGLAFLADFATQDRLRAWQRLEVTALATSFDDTAIKYDDWVAQHPVSPEASHDALRRLYAWIKAGKA